MIRGRLLLSTLIWISIIACSQTRKLGDVDFEYKICNWKGDKRAAVALTFDDWTPGHPAIVVPELQKRKMVATFNVITSTVKDWVSLKEAAKAGNEMANHTATHPYVNASYLYTKEISEAKRKIEKEVEIPVFTFAYPYGAFNDSLIAYLKTSGHIAARGVYSPSSSESYSYGFINSENDYYNTNAYGMKTETKIEEFASEIDKVVKNGGMLTYLYHSVYNKDVPDFSYAWISDTLFKQQLDTLASYEDRVWVTTYANAIKYNKEAQCAKLQETKSDNKTKRVFLLTDTLDNKTYDQPLTIIVNVGDHRVYGVKQNGMDVSFKYVADDRIQFEAVPDFGEIVFKQEM